MESTRTAIARVSECYRVCSSLERTLVRPMLIAKRRVRVCPIQLAIFLQTSGFDDKLFTFLHSEADALEISPEGEEQKLDVYEAYQRFTKLFDGEFAEFMEKTGCASMDEMYERLSQEDKADSRASRFFEGLLAGMEYTSFITLVRNFQEADDDDDDDDDADDDDDDGGGECDDDDDADQVHCFLHRRNGALDGQGRGPVLHVRGVAGELKLSMSLRVAQISPCESV